MDHRSAVIVGDDADFQRDGARRRTDEHRHSVVIGLERLPVMSKGVKHVVVGDTVLASARLDVHFSRVATNEWTVNTC